VRIGARAVPHQADAPNLAGEVAETGADLEPELAQQSAAHRGLVDPARHAHGVELRQASRRRDEERDAHRLEPRAQRRVVQGVPPPGILEPFLAQHEQRLVQRVERVDRRGVVVGPTHSLPPVAHHEVEVEEPTRHTRAARLQPRHGATPPAS
jgi:hypothetical protein